MKNITIALYTVILLGIATTSFANGFGNEDRYTWADTPIGRFECRADKSTKYSQVLKINGKEIYREPDNLTISGGGNSLFDGISMGPRQGGSSGCPKILENKEGYVVYEYEQAREISNNSLVKITDVNGVMNYEVINFNVSPPIIINLTQVKLREGKTYLSSFNWDKEGFTLRYYGYPYNKMGDYPKPKLHTIRFVFATQKISRIK